MSAVESMEDYEELLKTVFCNDKGRKLLDVWRLNYVNRLSYMQGVDGSTVAFREGERSLILSILVTTGEL